MDTADNRDLTINRVIFCFYSSTLQDDFVVLHVPGEYDTVFETVFKTEFLTVLTKKYEAEVGRPLTLDFKDKYVKVELHCFFF